MEEELVSFETAKLAKEKGFNIPVIKHYTPKGYCNESEGYQTERLEESNWNDGMGSYPTLSKDVCCSAPTQSLLQKWLREVYNTHLMVEPFYNEQKVLVYGFDLITERIEEETIVEKGFKTYEEALEVGLQEALKLIEIVKEK
jgi:hypothetical protein